MAAERAARLRKNLGLIEAVALSLAIVAPTMAMAFNVTLAVGAAGAAAPLAFAIGTAALAIVALSFVAFGRRIAHAGSAYAYITLEFGPRIGFLAGWALLLTYLAYGTGTAVLVGNFVDAALADYGIAINGLWLAAGGAAVLLATALAHRDMRGAARLMLALEAASVLAILALGIRVLAALAPAGGLSLAPFAPDKGFGWSGIGYALVFAVLSFAGFEGAATLGEETDRPRRAIPIAVFGAVVLAGVFYVFASYVQVVGFGLDRVAALARDSAPLNTLALAFGSRGLAALLDIAAALSAFSCALGSLSAAARLLFALGRAGLAPRLGAVHAVHGTPAAAAAVAGGLMLAGIVLWGARAGAAAYYGAAGTIGTLALILVYIGVTAAGTAAAVRARQGARALLGAAGALVLLWPLYNTLYPVPAYPADLWPYAVLIYLVLGAALLALRPQTGRPALEEDPPAP
jgi:amino acid transporter